MAAEAPAADGPEEGSEVPAHGAAPVGPADHDSIVAAATAARTARRRRRARVAVGVSIVVTVLWAAYVTLAGQWGRVGQNWEAALTMVFGSVVAGATPQGSGAIAFPVLTKGLEVPSDVARTFTLCIQAVGMGAAATAILINRRLVEWRAIIIGGLAALTGFAAALFLLGDPSTPFWASRLPSSYIRVTFTLVLISMAFVVYLSTRVPIRKVETSLPPMNVRLYTALIVAGLLGGLASSLTGSGADVMLFLFIVVLFGIDPRVGVASSVVVMAAVSVLGFLVLGIGHGQLATELSDGITGSVVGVGGEPVSGSVADGTVVPVHGAGDGALPAQRFDLFGMWIAALPVVAWGAPLGAWLASRMKARQLVYLALTLAAVETISTVVLLDGLHRFSGLLLYGVISAVAMLAGLYLLARHRRTIFRLPGLSPEETLSRGSLDVAPGYQRELKGSGDRTAPDAAGNEEER